MCPITHVSYLAVGAAVIASFIFGFLWYGPLFGKTWAGLMGIKMDKKEGCTKPPASSMLLTILGTSFTVFALAYLIGNGKGCSCPVGTAGLMWLGFYVPLLLGSVTWEGKPWKLFALNAAYYFLNLQLIAAILTYLK